MINLSIKTDISTFYFYVLLNVIIFPKSIINVFPFYMNKLWNKGLNQEYI